MTPPKGGTTNLWYIHFWKSPYFQSVASAYTMYQKLWQQYFNE
ncbi:Uncharacterized protein dnm_091350 [Desulfonema magnum]|uniref:Uncharacterized protein n=1 Tax=Desulfonema magnum TaxID=45655 RepID=A0A975BXK8_9BACT|nr:Uncharacterized protein dnm_091350 [Desulfonema magnum]